MTIKSINDEIRKLEDILTWKGVSVKDKEYYQHEIRTLREVRDLIEKTYARITTDRYGERVICVFREEILGEVE